MFFDWGVDLSRHSGHLDISRRGSLFLGWSLSLGGPSGDLEMGGGSECSIGWGVDRRGEGPLGSAMGLRIWHLNHPFATERSCGVGLDLFYSSP